MDRVAVSRHLRLPRYFHNCRESEVETDGSREVGCRKVQAGPRLTVASDRFEEWIGIKRNLRKGGEETCAIDSRDDYVSAREGG